MTPEEIRKEAQDAWDEIYKVNLIPCNFNKAFDEFLSEREKGNEAVAVATLQPWMQLLEDSIQWLGSLAELLSKMVSQPDCPGSTRTIWSLVGASCTFSVAVRRLILSGLDIPARGLTRVLDEHLCACILFLDDPQLAQQFFDCDSPEASNSFWYKHLNSKAIKKRMKLIEGKIGIKAEDSEDLHGWRNEEIGMFSQAIHPTYVSSALASVDLLSEDAEPGFGPAYGASSVVGERAVKYACKSIWYFSRIGCLILFNEYSGRPPLIDFNEESDLIHLVVLGRDVLSKLNIKYWEYDAIQVQANNN